MRRKLLHLAIGVSLVLCVLTATLWVRSYVRYDRVDGGHRHQVQIRSAVGELSTRIITTEQMPPVPVRWQSFNPHWLEAGNRGDTIAMEAAMTGRFYEEPPPAYTTFGQQPHSWPGLVYQRQERHRPDAGVVIVTLSYWLLLLLSAAVPSSWLSIAFLRRRWHRKRIRARRCATCGYDLRATPDRCPECGTTQESAPQAAA